MIRPFARNDAGRAVTLLRGLIPQWVTSERGLVHWVESAPERGRLRAWVAEEGDVLGWGEAFLRWDLSDESIGFVWVGVRPDARGAGVGSGLYDLAVRHLAGAGATKLETFTPDETGERFVRARGFRETRAEQCWSLDPSSVDLSALAELEAAKAAEGFRLVRLADVRDRPDDLYRLFTEVHADVPSDHTHDESYEDWLRTLFEYPDLDDEGSAVVLAGDRPAAFAFVGVDREGGRGTHMMTGTAREFRHRGLARLAKLATIRWAAENGVTALLTENDTTNADMLALNEHLGYRPTITLQYFAREFEP